MSRKYLAERWFGSLNHKEKSVFVHIFSWKRGCNFGGKEMYYMLKAECIFFLFFKDTVSGISPKQY